MTEAATNPRKVKTVAFRMSFPALLTPRVQEENGVKKESYQLSMLFPPGTDHGPVKAALRAAMVAEFGEDTSKWPKLKRGPSEVVRDFAAYNADNDKPLPGDWTGWTFIRANANVKNPPAIVGPFKDAAGKFPTIKDQREIYGGRWARATLEGFYYNHKTGGKGVTFGLLNVQLLKNDTKFGNAVSDPNKDFDNAPEQWADDAGAEDFGNQPQEQKPAAAEADGWN